MPFIGTDGIMLKTTTMDAVKTYPDLEGEGIVLAPSSPRRIMEGNYREDNDNSVTLPKIQIIVATKSAEAGINGKCLKFGRMSGFPNNFYEVVQQLGRVDRGTAKPGENTYETHVDFYSYVSLFVRIMSCDNADERMIQLAQLHEVMKVALLPEVCYYTAMERKFEWTTDAGKTGCEHYCSHCRGDVKKFTKRVNKERLQSLLTKQFNER